MVTYENSTIVRSIPLPFQFKRYYTHKFKVMVDNNGVAFACEAFSDLLEFAKFYLSKGALKECKMEFHNRVPWLPWNNRMKQYLKLLKAQPEYVLNFTKLYTSQGSLGTSKAFMEDYKSEMDSIPYRADVPKFLVEFLTALDRFGGIIIRYHNEPRQMNQHLRSLYDSQTAESDLLAQNHSFKQWRHYWFQCWDMFKPFSEREAHSANFSGMKRIPLPEIYSDSSTKRLPNEWSKHYSSKYQRLGKYITPSSNKFDEDTVAIAAALHGRMQGVGPDYLRAILSKHMYLEDIMRVPFDSNQWYKAGTVEAVHKVGTTTYRAIADTNKYLNFATRPLRNVLYDRMFRKGIHDATDDQDRFDPIFVERTTNKNLYIGSVDLHHATDYLPAVWGELLVQYLIGYSPINRAACDFQKGRNKELTLLGNSFIVFCELVQTPFDSEAGDILWHRGQPLGSEPSFMMLSWTHHFFSEALSWKMGYAHHPYYILGDDIIITNKKLRKRYIQIMRSCAVPLSLNKSYENRLAEFAGKIYVSKHRPFYTTDHKDYIGYNALFDWSRSTHIPLSWVNLPRTIKQRFSRELSKQLNLMDMPGLAAGSEYFNLISKLVSEDPTYLNGIEDAVEGWFNYLIPAQDRLEIALGMGKWSHYASGIISFQNQPIQLMSTQYTNKDGHWQRYNPVHVKPWFIQKFRPFTTDAYIRAGIRAMEYLKRDTGDSTK